jgi:hypothetical protein
MKASLSIEDGGLLAGEIPFANNAWCRSGSTCTAMSCWQIGGWPSLGNFRFALTRSNEQEIEMNALLDVVGVQAHADFSLVLTFENNETRRFDMAPYMNQIPWSRIKEASLFCAARAEMGTVVWPGNIDIDPETLYERSVALEPCPT